MKNVTQHVFITSLFVIATAAPSQAAIEPYGFIRATAITASKAVDSFGNANLVAPVKAAPDSVTDPLSPRSSFEFAQTRAGIRIPGDKVNGLLEIDFIDFSKATAGTKALPRLRIAAINYKFSETQLIEIGQDWDIFSPTKPATYNFVGLYFNAGNAGFMRPQVKYKQDLGNLHWEAGVGLAGSPAGNGVNNATATDSDLELNMMPSFASSLTYHSSKETLFGVSGIAGRIRFSGSYSVFYGLNAFTETVLWNNGSAHAEIYYGDKLGNSGSLTLAQATSATALTELGGYLTLQQELSENLRFMAGAGAAGILTSGGSPVQGYAGATILSNIKISTALAYRPTASVDYFVELANYTTKYRTVTNNATTIELGGVFNF